MIYLYSVGISTFQIAHNCFVCLTVPLHFLLVTDHISSASSKQQWLGSLMFCQTLRYLWGTPIKCLGFFHSLLQQEMTKVKLWTETASPVLNMHWKRKNFKHYNQMAKPNFSGKNWAVNRVLKISIDWSPCERSE